MFGEDLRQLGYDVRQALFSGNALDALSAQDLVVLRFAVYKPSQSDIVDGWIDGQ